MAYVFSSEGQQRVAGFHIGQVGSLLRAGRVGTLADMVAPRVLTYTTKDVIDERISLPAQHALVRLSKNAATSVDAVSMLEEIKANRLTGIFCVNSQKAAKRALRLGKSWWTIIPQGRTRCLCWTPITQ